MTLGRLIDRALGRVAVLQPRKPSVFEPSRETAPGMVTSLFARVEHDTRPPADSVELTRQQTEGPRRELESVAQPSRTESLPARPAESMRESTREGSPILAQPAAPVRSAQSDAEPPRATEAREFTAPKLLPVASEPPRRLGSSPRETLDAETLGVPPSERAERRPATGREQPAPGPSPRAPSPASPPTTTTVKETRVSAPPPLTLGARGEARRSSTLSEKASEPSPQIHVTIGRIEVRANAASPAAPRSSPRRAESAFTLRNYLQQRERHR